MFKKILSNLIIFLFPFFLFSQTTEWVQSFGGPNSDKGISIDADTMGNIYISGFFNGEITFGSTTLYSNSSSNKDMFLAKIDSSGNVVWAMSGGGGPFDDRALGMHVDKAGFIYLTGTFWGNITFAGVTATGNGYDSSLLTKIDSDGNCVWARSFGASSSGGGCPYPIYDGDDHSYDVKVDDAGYIYVTGFWSNYDAQFDNFTLTNPDWANCEPAGYVGKLDPNGNFIWVDQFDGIYDQRGSRDNRIAIDHFSNVYVTGGFENTGVYGPFNLNTNGEWDVFVFKMDSAGNWIWARNIGSNKSDRGNGIAIDDCDNIYINGEYRNPMHIDGAYASDGTDTLDHKKKRDGFVAKITTNGDWVWAKRVRSSKVDKFYQMSVDANEQVFVGGSAGDSLKFNSNITLSMGDTSINAFIAQIDGSGNSDWVWAKMAGGLTENDRMNDVCQNGENHIYAIGFYEQTANFDGTTFTSSGKKDVFVWKIRKAPVVPKKSNCIYVDVIPQGSGTIEIDGASVTQFPCYQSLKDSINHVFTALPAVGYAFDNWDWNIHATATPNQSPSTVLTYTDDTLRVYFNQIITDSIVIDVQPPGAGTVSLDGTLLNPYPNTTYVTQGSSSSLVATPNAGFNFSNWSASQQVITPNNNPSISLTWNGNDTVTAHFSSIPSYSITYLVNPTAGGTIDINTINQSVFPYTQSYLQGTQVTLNANSNPNYNFLNWSSLVHTLNPNPQTSFVDFTVQDDDTIQANYSYFDTLIIITEPANSATLQVGNDIITTSPYVGVYPSGSLLDIQAVPQAGNSFNQWELIPAALPDYNSTSSFLFTGQDTLFAYINTLTSIEELNTLFTSFSIQPTLFDNQFTIQFSIDKQHFIGLQLLDMNGASIHQFINEELMANAYAFTSSNMSSLSAGMYLLAIQFDKQYYILPLQKK